MRTAETLVRMFGDPSRTEVETSLEYHLLRMEKRLCAAKRTIRSLKNRIPHYVRNKRYYLRHPERVRQSKGKQETKQRNELADAYVKRVIHQETNGRLSCTDIHPSLVVLKRAQLKAFRITHPGKERISNETEL